METFDVETLLANSDDFELCNGAFVRFADLDGCVMRDSYLEEERVVRLSWHASGLIGNGGFKYLFEGWFEGDPGYLYTAAAFKTAGALESYAAFQRALSTFGGRYPLDAKERSEAFLRVPEAERDAIDSQFFDAASNLSLRLATYIRARRERFRQLLTRRVRRAWWQRLFR